MDGAHRLVVKPEACSSTIMYESVVGRGRLESRSGRRKRAGASHPDAALLQGGILPQQNGGVKDGCVEAYGGGSDGEGAQDLRLNTSNNRI